MAVMPNDNETLQRTPQRNTGLFLASLAAVFALLAAAEQTAPVALVGGRLLLLLGSALMLGALLVLRKNPGSRLSGSLLPVSIGSLLGGAFGEGLARIIARPLSEDIYPGTLSVLLVVAATVLTYRLNRPSTSATLLSMGALSVMSATSIGIGIQSASILAVGLLNFIPVAAIAIMVARVGSGAVLSARSRVALTALFASGFLAAGQIAATLTLQEASTDGSSDSLLLALIGAASAVAVSALPVRLFRRSALASLLAVPMVLSLVTSSVSALVPLETVKTDGLFAAESRLEADTKLLNGMNSDVGAGPREKYRGYDFYECDQASSRDCFITYYDTIALKEGVAAAVADLIDKVHNNKGRTFPSHCHQVAHNLGQIAFMLGDSFNDAAVLDPQVCGTGYTHGLWEQQFEVLGTDVMFNRTATLCDELNMTTPWYSWTCHHILGHLMAATLAQDPGMAASYCRKVEVVQDRTDCLTGAWMNFFQDDGVLALMRSSATLEDLFGVCWGAPEETKFFCYQELFPAIYVMLNYDDYAAGRACVDYAEPARGTGDPWLEDTQNYLDRCAQGLARAVAVSSAQNFLVMRDRCLLMPDEVRDTCLTGTAASYVLNTGSLDGAFVICREVRDQEYRDYCYFWTKFSRSILANGPNSENLPEPGELRLPENAPISPELTDRSPSFGM